MRDALLTAARGLGGFVQALGLRGVLSLFVALILISLVLGFLDRAATILGRFERRWNRWSRSTRWSIVVLALFVFFPVIRALVPWRDAFLAAVCGGFVVLIVAGYVYGDRYGVHDSPWAAVAYHLRVTVRKRQFGKAIDASTGKKKNRAVRMRLGRDGDTITAHPGEGISARDLVDQFNAGTHTSAIANQFGWHDVKDVSAIPLQDGTVLVRVAHEVRQSETLRPEWVEA